MQISPCTGIRRSFVQQTIGALTSRAIWALLSVALTGCVQEPTVGTVVTHTSEPHPPLKTVLPKKPPRPNIALPSNVVALAYGVYPPPPFSPPPTGGTLYVWDNDDKQVAWMTSYAPWKGEQAPVPVNLDADVPEARESLTPGHHYTIYYAPPPQAPATLPAAH